MAHFLDNKRVLLGSTEAVDNFIYVAAATLDEQGQGVNEVITQGTILKLKNQQTGFVLGLLCPKHKPVLAENVVICTQRLPTGPTKGVLLSEAVVLQNHPPPAAEIVDGCKLRWSALVTQSMVENRRSSRERTQEAEVYWAARARATES